jgi:hypothetical protein
MKKLNQSAMKKLLLTFALAAVVSAGAASRAYGYCALAYNTVTGNIGMIHNCNTLEEAKRQALSACPGGRIEFANGARGFYAVDFWRDGKGNIGVSWGPGYSTPSEARRQADKWCKDRGYTITKYSASWQETVGSPVVMEMGKALRADE